MVRQAVRPGKGDLEFQGATKESQSRKKGPAARKGADSALKHMNGKLAVICKIKPLPHTENQILRCLTSISAFGLHELLLAVFKLVKSFPALVSLVVPVLVEFMLAALDLLPTLVALPLTRLFPGLALATLFARRQPDLLSFRVRPHSPQVAFFLLTGVQFSQLLQAMLHFIRHAVTVCVLRLASENVDEVVD